MGNVSAQSYSLNPFSQLMKFLLMYKSNHRIPKYNIIAILLNLTFYYMNWMMMEKKKNHTALIFASKNDHHGNAQISSSFGNCRGDIMFFNPLICEPYFLVHDIGVNPKHNSIIKVTKIDGTHRKII